MCTPTWFSTESKRLRLKSSEYTIIPILHRAAFWNRRHTKHELFLTSQCTGFHHPKCSWQKTCKSRFLFMVLPIKAFQFLHLPAEPLPVYLAEWLGFWFDNYFCHKSHQTGGTLHRGNAEVTLSFASIKLAFLRVHSSQLLYTWWELKRIHKVNQGC